MSAPVKSWVEPDRWAVLRAFPLQTLLLFLGSVVSISLGYALHPVFFVLTALATMRQAATEASLRELFRDGMLHPSRVLGGRLATLVRLEHEGRMQDAVVISRMPRRWTRSAPPWGGARAAVVIAGDPPRLRPLSMDVAVRDPARGRRAIERIPEVQWHALERALDQIATTAEGVHPVELGRAPWYGRVREIEAEGSLPLAAIGAHPWCAGLPCIEQPSMASEERARIARLRRAAWRRAAALALALAATFASAAITALPLVVRSALAALVLLGGPLVLLAIAREAARVRAYGRDLASGVLLRFGGTLSNFDSLAFERDLARLARRGVITPEPGLEQDLVVLREARELLHANGKWTSDRSKLRVSEVAAPPEDSIKLALPAELRSERPAHDLELARRRFSESERRELAHHVQGLRKPGAAFLLLTPLALSLLLVWERASAQVSFASAPFVLALWLLSAQAFWRRLRLAARLRADGELGWVITVDHAPHVLDGDSELPARGIESLLHARVDWTVNRRPASWRRAGS